MEILTASCLSLDSSHLGNPWGSPSLGGVWHSASSDSSCPGRTYGNVCTWQHFILDQLEVSSNIHRLWESFISISTLSSKLSIRSDISWSALLSSTFSHMHVCTTCRGLYKDSLSSSECREGIQLKVNSFWIVLWNADPLIYPSHHVLAVQKLCFKGDSLVTSDQLPSQFYPNQHS